jgi:hypothetical protein
MCPIYLRPISNVECSVGGNLELRQTIEDKILVLFDGVGIVNGQQRYTFCSLKKHTRTFCL